MFCKHTILEWWYVLDRAECIQVLFSSDSHSLLRTNYRKDYIVPRPTTCFPLRSIFWWIKQNHMFDVWRNVQMVVSLILKTTDFTKNRKKSPRRKTLISWAEKSILNVFCQAAATRPNSKHSFFFLTFWLVCKQSIL